MLQVCARAGALASNLTIVSRQNMLSANLFNWKKTRARVCDKLLCSPHLCVGFLFLLADSRLLLLRLLLRRSSSSSLISTPLTQLHFHNSSHTTPLTQLILHYFTYPTHLSQLILIQLTSHNSSPTTHLTPTHLTRPHLPHSSLTTNLQQLM